MNLIEKIKRQIEILVLCSSESNVKITCADLALRFKVEEITIKRDLSYLRSLGFDIHSSKRYGIKIFRNNDKNKLTELVFEYVALSCQKYSMFLLEWFVNSINNLDKAICYIILQHCIARHIEAKIRYMVDDTGSEAEFRIIPHLIDQLNNKIVLHASKYGIKDKFYLEKITSVVALDAINQGL